MRVSIVYIYPQLGGDHYKNLAVRFLKSYNDYPPGMEHESIVVCNGHPPTEEAQFIFGSLPKLTLMHHNNAGYDLGGYQLASRTFPEIDLMVFFGASSYLRGPGWLARMVQAWWSHGDTLYGAMGNRGSGHVQPHIRTTGMWMSPALFNNYPHLITEPHHRYNFEHGSICFTTWIKNRKKIPWVVAWDGDYREAAWDSIPGGYHKGLQHNLICGDRLTCPVFYHCS